MLIPTSTHTDKQAWTKDVGRRRSMRVLLSVPIVVAGKDSQGKDFSEDTRTLVVNAHGALISLTTPVVAAQEVLISNKATHKSLECRIVYLGNAQDNKTQMGIEFVKPSATFWQIDFPPDDWIVPES
ncbi:MAG TPA: hypothetical protein VG322_02460 [Candidatus Acidoferrales bacterium]|jgi:hypothetical protein|nr:hypothetical protein [Candidatus Acidoferrales bacterium]